MKIIILHLRAAGPNNAGADANAVVQVGKFIQVRASRRLEVADGSPFVYSLAIKGPVTVDDETARAMLLMLTKVRASWEQGLQEG